MGLAVPPRCADRQSSTFDPREVLAFLSRGSGGASYLIPSQPYPRDWHEKLGGVFNRIFEHLEGEGSITYRPVPFGEGPNDGAETNRARRRKVRVRWKRRQLNRRCRLEASGPPFRYEGAARPSRQDDRLRDLLNAAEPAPTLTPPLRLALPSPWTAACREGDKPPDDGPCQAVGSTYLELGPGGARGRVLDLIHEQGRLYKERLSPGRKTYDVTIEWKPRFAVREFALDPPPLERVQRGWNSLELALLLETRFARQPAIVHGSTFIQLRSRLGQALMARSDYRQWARRRLYQDNRRRLRALWHDVDRRQWEKIEPLLDLQARQILPAAPQRVLAVWLGDIDAVVLAQRLQERAIRALLAPPQGPKAAVGRARAAKLASLIQQNWQRWATWFPVASDQRVVVPLIPIYDPRRDVIGYYRVLLPAPGPRGAGSGLPPHRWPDAPLALMLASSLTGRPTVAAALEGKAMLLGLGWADYSRQDAVFLRRKWQLRQTEPDGASLPASPIGQTRHVLALTLAPAGAGQAANASQEDLVTLRAYYAEPRGSAPPLCLELLPAARDAVLPAWATPLHRALGAEGLLCSPAPAEESRQSTGPRASA
ncbi:MAG: hypothetical protein Q9Q40_14575 [Acidobacteriota bacterium]|nr:hypothetical protein [Acidobacteriota bacterium]